MVLGYGVIGTAINFNKQHERWNGQSEYIVLLKELLKRDHERIYLVSKTNWSSISPELKKEIDPQNKIIDIFADIDTNKIKKQKIKKTYSSDTERLDAEYDYSYFLWNHIKENNIKIDRCLFFASQGMKSPIAIPGQLYTKVGERRRGKVLMMAMNYSSPVLVYINESKVKWDLIGTDPRYLCAKMYPRGIINPPKTIFGQKTFDLTWETLDHYNNYDDYSESKKTFKCHYGEVEKINTFSKPLIDSEKDTELMIVASNVVGAEIPLKSNKRFQEIKKYLLDTNIQVDIYGDWPQEVFDKYSQFKGFISGDQVDDKMSKAKYTILFPLKDGWLSSKLGEMLRVGVIPFIHPDYDIQRNALPKNDFIRIKDGEDLKRKIDFLNKNPQDREDLLKKLRKKYLTESSSVFSLWNSIIGEEVY